jgi:hypothetical protein
MIFKKIIKTLIKIVTIPFIVVLFILFPDVFASTGETQTWYVFSWSYIFEDINYESFQTEILLENLEINTSSGTYQTINYKEDLQDIKAILYQILLIIFFTCFFHLTWIFYTFKNDLLWKR